MRETRIPQTSIFENYAEHEHAQQLKRLSRLLDEHRSQLLPLVRKDLVSPTVKKIGNCGLSVESVFRCLVLKQLLQVGYEQLAFHLSDSMSYQTFARVMNGRSPSRSTLQATIRRIQPRTLEKIHQRLSFVHYNQGEITLDRIRMDSTVVKSAIAPPRDSQLLNDGVRVLSRLFAKSREKTGVKIRFTDKRKEAKALAYRIFHAKKAEKHALYPLLLRAVRVVLKQAERALIQVKAQGNPSKNQWCEQIEHYRELLLKVVDQTQRRVIQGENVPASEKIVSLFECHTDIIIKGAREVDYGHKINLSSDAKGLITYVGIEDGNPKDSQRFIPIIQGHLQTYGEVPTSTVGDGCYASQTNVHEAKALGIKRVVFHKKQGISYTAMGVKKKTYQRMREFRAGIEGNISELKRKFGVAKATWKGLDGFKAFVWSSVISYNLVRLARAQSG